MLKVSIWGFVCLALSLQAAAVSPSMKAATGRLRFEPLGDGRYAAAGIRYQFIFGADRVTYKRGLDGGLLQFAGASQAAHLTATDQLVSVTNRFVGSDRTQWKTGIANYGRLRTNGLYPGIDAVYYGTAGELEYDLNVKPGANPSCIRMRFSDANARIDANGNVGGGLLQKKPVAYQIASDGTRHNIECRYRRNSDGTFGFALGRYDRRRELIIDPVLTFSSYIAGSSEEWARAIGHDSAGFLYVGGVTYSSDLPVSGDAEQGTTGGGIDVFVVKMDPHAAPGSEIVYATYFGGSGADSLNDMAVSPSGTVYLAGTTTSSNLPTANAPQSALAGASDAFVARIDPAQAGSGLLFSTYLGGAGDDAANAITVDASGRIFVAGTTKSTDFPSIGAYQGGSAGSWDAFVTGYDAGGALIYSTYLGGGGEDEARGIAVDANGNLWIAGGTYSYDFPLVGNPYQAGNRVSGDAFLVELSTSAGILYSTYLGGTNLDWATRVRVDPAGRVLVAGYTASTEFPITANALQPQLAGYMNAFAMIWTPVAGGAPQLTYSTYYGGGAGDVAYDIRGDADGLVYLVGYTTSRGLFTTPGALQATGEGGTDGFALKFNPAISGRDGIDYASYVASNGTQVAYAVDVDAAGNMYVAGQTTGSMFADFPATGRARTTLPGTSDAFVAGFSPCTATLPIASEQFPTGGGSDRLSLTISRDCRWTASSPVDWVTVTPASGSTNANLTINVAPNATGAERQATVNIGGAPFLVGQNP